eukprot:TRINITY_DN44175_c0_g1_i3.p1 TRINITY_DN44175_c0_g1~~TRINITY_DN44175_c0_g1_i3.p1  ORF type:complete len:470 (-),score=63.37 TRINITY_DN44175_c0_g1_i3:10-1419(-)
MQQDLCGVCGVDSEPFALGAAARSFPSREPRPKKESGERNGIAPVGSSLGSAPFKFQTAGVGKNGKVYGIPFALQIKKVIEYDPESGCLNEIGPELENGNARYVAAVCADNGKIFALPCNSQRVLEIDPEKASVRAVGKEMPYGGLKYQAAVLASNGKVYGVPFNAKRFLEVDPETGDTSEVGSELPNGGFKYMTAHAAANGRIYALPFDEATHVLEFDPRTRESRQIGHAFPKGGAKYAASVLAPNGRIYGLPCAARHLLEICPEAGDARTIGPDLGPGFKYQAAAVSGAAYGGRVYGIPFDATRVLELDPETADIREVGPPLPGKGDRYTAAVTTADGRAIYALPNNSTRILQIELKKASESTRGHTTALEAEVSEVGPTLDGVNELVGKGQEEHYQIGVLAPNGKVYALPFNAEHILEVDPHTLLSSQSDDAHKSQVCEEGFISEGTSKEASLAASGGGMLLDSMD